VSPDSPDTIASTVWWVSPLDLAAGCPSLGSTQPAHTGKNDHIRQQHHRSDGESGRLGIPIGFLICDDDKRPKKLNRP
jgi:hypothetical protein